MKRTCIFKNDAIVEREFGKVGLLFKALPKIKEKMRCEACLSEEMMRSCRLYVPYRDNGRCSNGE